MSAQETTPQEPGLFDPTSSISITLNAKQQHQWVVKIRAQSNRPVDVQEAFDLAVKLDADLVAKYGAQAGAA